MSDTKLTRMPVVSANRADLLRLALQMALEAERIGGRLRERRDELGLTQREVAERLPGKAQPKDISRWEHGRHRPHDDTLAELASALETDVDDLRAGKLGERKAKAPVPDPFASNGSAGAVADLHSKLDQVLDQQAELLGAVELLRGDQARLLRAQGLGGQDEAATGS